MSHTQYADLRNLLKRAHRHLATNVTAIETDRDDLAIVRQMQPVIGALEKAKAALIADYIEHHLEEIVGPLPREARERLASLA